VCPDHMQAPLDGETLRLCAVHGIPYLADAEVDLGGAAAAHTGDDRSAYFPSIPRFST
jgi:hypothetical protein